jgi:hypothetical protein
MNPAELDALCWTHPKVRVHLSQRAWAVGCQCTHRVVWAWKPTLRLLQHSASALTSEPRRSV